MSGDGDSSSSSDDDGYDDLCNIDHSTVAWYDLQLAATVLIHGDTDDRPYMDDGKVVVTPTSMPHMFSGVLCDERMCLIARRQHKWAKSRNSINVRSRSIKASCMHPHCQRRYAPARSMVVWGDNAESYQHQRQMLSAER